MLKRLVLFICVLLGCLTSALAQNRSERIFKKWEFSGFYGLSGAGEGTHSTQRGENQLQSVGLDFANGYVVGARITENLKEHFGAELEYGYANQPARFTGLAPTLPALELDQRVHKMTYSILFYPTNRSSRIRPYASIGAGASFYYVTSESEQDALAKGVDLTNRWKLAVSYGAGVKFAVDRQWGFRGDFRDHLTGVPDYGLPTRATLGPAFRPDGLLHNWQFSGGLFYMFNFD